MTREEAIDIIKCLAWHTRPNEEDIELAIKTLSAEPCDDCISRAELLKAIDTWDKFGVDDTNSLFRLDNLSLPHYVPYIHYDDVIKCIKGMPSVTPKQKMGHWEWLTEDKYRCSNCNHETRVDECMNKPLYDFCPFCGAKMESGDQK